MNGSLINYNYGPNTATIHHSTNMYVYCCFGSSVITFQIIKKRVYDTLHYAADRGFRFKFGRIRFIINLFNTLYIL